MFAKPSMVKAFIGATMLAAACAPAAQPSPTAAPAKPAATTAPAKQASQPAATTAPAKPAATQAAAKPAASPAAKAAFDEKAIADFYQGKTIRIIVGFAPGGGYDTSSRLLAKYLPKYLPGSPSVVVENVTGAGSMIAANQVFRTADKDGTVIGDFNSNLVLLQALEKEGIEYDAGKFQWIGSLGDTPSACVVRTDVGINSFQEVMAGKELIVGGEAPGTTTHDVPSIIKAALGANIKIVAGYDGTSKMRLAVENKEVDAACWSWDSIQSTARSWFESSPPFAKPLIVMGSKAPDDELMKGVPAAETLAKSEDDKRLLAAVNAPSEMTWPFAVAPEVPKDRVAALRQAFDQATADKDFLADAEKASLNVRPKSGAQVEDLVKQVLDTPPAVLERLKSILK